MKNFLVFIAVVFMANVLSGQKVHVELNLSHSSIPLNENFQLELKLVNVTGTATLEEIDLSDFETIGQPRAGNQQGWTEINGKRSFSQYTTRTYQLKPKKTGKFTIKALRLKVNNKMYKTNSVTINVTAASQKMFVVVNVDKKKVVVGEPVIVSYVIYAKQNIGVFRSSENLVIPENTGFWKEEFDVKQEWKQKTIKGSLYSYVEVQRHILYPQKGGELEIGSFEFTGMFGSRFRRSQTRHSSKSSVIKIEVLPLPAGKPVNYIGAFESLSLKVTTSSKELEVNNAIDLHAIFEGVGNMKLINDFQLEFPSDFEVYDPKIKDRITIGYYNESGKRSFDYILIPRSEGQYVIPEKTYSYYNYKEKKYKYLKSTGQSFYILPGDVNSNQNYTFNSKNDVNVLGQDIRYIKTNTENFEVEKSPFFGSTSHYALLGLPMFMFFGFFFYHKRQDTIANNPLTYKKNKAGKVAAKHLSIAKSLVNQNKAEEFYESISGALFGYLQDKFGISMSEMSKENIRIALIDKGADNSAIDKLINAIEICELARYAPSGVNSETELLSNAEEVINALEG